jgi:hypothetical protein
LGGAAVYRFDKSFVFNWGFSPEVRAGDSFSKPFSPVVAFSGAKSPEVGTIAARLKPCPDTSDLWDDLL